MAESASEPIWPWRLWLAACAIGLPVAWAGFNDLAALSDSARRHPYATFFAAALVATLASGLLLIGAWPQLRAYRPPQRVGWVLCCLLVGAFLVAVIPLNVAPAPGDAGDQARAASIYAGNAFVIGLVVLWLALSLVTWRPDSAPPVKIGRWLWLWYALPCAAVWLIYLLAFWPGILSPDSIAQWGQFTQGPIIDAHPAFHTMTLWLITRLWLSPAAVALVQIILLSVVVSVGLALLRSYGAPAWSTWLVCALVAFSPVNGLMVITLWKDILFTISVLALTVLILLLVHSCGEALKRRRYLIVLMLVLPLVALFRQNGPLVAFGSLLALILAYSRHRLRLGLLLIGVIGVWLLVRGPVYSAARVQKGPVWFTLQPVLTQVASYVKAGALQRGNPLEPDQVSLLNAIHPLANGWQEFDCFDSNSLLFAPDTNKTVIDQNASQLVDIYLRLVRRDPGFLVAEMIRCNSIVWRVTNPPDGKMAMASVYRGSAGELISILISPFPNRVHLVSNSQLPGLEQWLAGLYQATLPDNLNWIVWRPALYSYLLLASVVLAALRLKSWRYLLVCVPALLTTLPYLAVTISPEFRYHYPAYLASLLLSLPLVLLPRAISTSAEASAA